MRKIILSLVALVLIVNISNAQENNRKFKLGIYGDLGTSWAKPKVDNYSRNGITSAYGYGLLFDYYFTQNYIFSTGLYIDYLGGKLSFDHKQTIDTSVYVGVMNRKYALQYLEIPLSLKLKTNQIGYLSYFVQLGFNTGFRLKATNDDKFEYLPEKYNEPENYDYKKNTHFFKFSFVVGLGTEYEINKSLSVFGQVNFNNGMSNFLDNTNAINSNVKETAILNKIGITAGLIF